MNAEFGPGSVAPLAAIVRSGRAGEVRLRLMLAFLWMSGGGDSRHNVTFPARAWAELLDLNDPSDAGERRVRDAIAWLERQGFVAVERPPGKPPIVTLRRDDGSGEAYSQPVRGPKDKATGKLIRADWNVRLPSGFWAKGWVIALSTRGLALLLVLLDLERKDGQPPWVSPDESRRRYGLSEDTWTRGIAELRGHGIVTVVREPVSATFGWKRVRNKYLVNKQRLEGDPDWAS